MKIGSIATAAVLILMVLALNACGDGKSDSGGAQQRAVQCAVNQILNNGQCQTCPAGQSVVGNQCVLQCAANQVIQNGQCVNIKPQCTGNQIVQNGSCVACLEAQVPNIERTMCIDNRSQCQSNQIEENGLCVTCPAGQFASGNVCSTPPAPPVSCGANQIVQNNMCVDCGANEMVSNNMCVPIPVTCGPTQIIVNNMCVDCPPGDIVINNMCVTPAPGNTAPVVNAGGDQSITLPTDTVTLAGSASDDGLPNPPGVLTTMWTTLSGPASVNYGDVTSPTSTAQFSVAGTYELQLTADDSDLAVMDSMMVTVSPQFNNPPTVNSLTATPNIMTLPTNTSSIVGSASDGDGPNPLTYSWAGNGPGAVSFNPGNTASTTATFPSAGTYTITLTAHDGDKSGSRNVGVTVNPMPVMCPANSTFNGTDCTCSPGYRNFNNVCTIYPGDALHPGGAVGADADCSLCHIVTVPPL
jgi:hypothetical protein